MPLRIVDEKGLGYTAHVFDAETGEDLTTRLRVTAIDLRMRSNEVVTASITSIAPKVEVTVPEAQVHQVCSYCGHTPHEYLLANARDLDTVPEKNGKVEHFGGNNPYPDDPIFGRLWLRFHALLSTYPGLHWEAYGDHEKNHKVYA
ncbi:MAG: hypothetical protein ACRDHW_24250, partial [Ktedonobacteraceae bacterium]